MAAPLQEIQTRIETLEDLDAVRSAIIGFETTRDGPPENARKLLRYLAPNVRFHWVLEGIVIRGRDKLCDYLREGMTPRVWCRHMVTNLEVVVRGRKATATWYVLSESVSRPNLERLRKGDMRARQTAPATGDTIVRSDTKGGKVATMVKSKDGWRFSDYRIEMTRISVSHVKVQ